MQYILWYNFRYTCKIHCNRHIYNIISYHLFSELLHHCTFLLNELYYFYVESYIKFRSILLLLKFRTPYLCKTCKTYNNNKNYALSRKLIFKQVIRNTIACKYFLQPPQVIRRRTLHCGAWETLVRGYTSSGFSLGFFFFARPWNRGKSTRREKDVGETVVSCLRGREEGRARRGGERMEPKEGKKVDTGGSAFITCTVTYSLWADIAFYVFPFNEFLAPSCLEQLGTVATECRRKNVQLLPSNVHTGRLVSLHVEKH